MDRLDLLCKAKTLCGEWVEGSLIYSPDADKGYKAIIIEIDKGDMYSSRGGDLGFEKYNKVDPSTICKCTGLKDKNGVLIYEGDVVGFKEEYEDDLCGRTYMQTYETCFEDLAYYFKPFFYAWIEDKRIRDYIDEPMLGMDMINKNVIDGIYLSNIHDKVKET